MPDPSLVLALVGLGNVMVYLVNTSEQAFVQRAAVKVVPKKKVLPLFAHLYVGIHLFSDIFSYFPNSAAYWARNDLVVDAP